jgi:hypothetical protein
MPTAHLALARQAVPPAVFRYLNGSVTQVGNTFGTAESPADTPGVDMNTQRVCQFKGSNDLYTSNRDDIYKYNKGTGDWTSVHTLLTPSAAGDSTRVGPLVMQVAGVPTMVVVYASAIGTEWRIATSIDGTTWNTSAVITGAFHNNTERPIIKPIVVGQLLWFFTANNTNLLYYMGVNPTLNTITTILAAGVGGCVSNFSGFLLPTHLIWNGVHYAVSHSTDNTGKHTLYSFDGATFTVVTDLNLTSVLGGNNTNRDTRYAAFTDGTDLYCIMMGRFTGAGFLGWYCWRVEPNLTVTDVTVAVMPTSLSPYVTPAKDQDGGWGVLVDQEANPGGVPEIYLYYRANGTATTPWAVYKWNGNATLMGNGGAATGVGGDGSHSMAFDQLGSGKVFYSEDQLDVSIELIEQALGGQTVSFRLYSATGTETVDVDFFYNDESEAANTGPASILNASAGAIVSDVIEGLTADNGATLYTVLWDTTPTGDNVPNGTAANLQARVSV